MRPGERFASSVPRGLSTWDGNCTWNLTPRSSFGSQFTKSVTKRGPQLPVAAILVSAKHIVFDDGTTYTAAAIPQAGAVLSVDLPVQTARVAAGPPLVTPSQVLNSPLEAVDAIRIVGVQGAISSRNDYFRENVCVPSTNHDARVAKAAWFDLEVVDRNGIVVGTKRTVARGTFSKDIPATGMACMFIDGRRISGDDFSYIPTGDSTPIVVGRIIAVPAELDFTDGTSWTSPTPPVVGQPAIFP